MDDWQILELAQSIARAASHPHIAKKIADRIERKTVKEVHALVKDMLARPSEFYRIIGMSDIRKLNAEVVAVDIRKADATKLIEHPFKPQTHSNSQTPQPSQPTPSDLPVMREMMSLVIQQQQDTRKWMQQTIDAYADITSKQPKIIANALSIHKINGAIEAAIAEASTRTRR